MSTGSSHEPSIPAALKEASILAVREAAPFDRQLAGAASGELAPATTAPSKMPDGATILGAFRRRWLAAMVLGVLLAAGGGVATRLSLPLRFTARVRVHIATRQPSVIQATDGGGDFTNFQRTQAELIKSQLVLKVALDRPEVAALPMIREQAEPIPWIEQQLLTDFPAPEILRLTFNGKDRLDLEVLLTAITEAYLQEVVNKEKSEREKQLKLLTVVRDKWDTELKTKRGEFRDKAKAAGAADAQTLAFSHRLALAQLDSARTDLLQFQRELRKLEVEMKIREQRPETAVAVPNVPDATVEDQLKLDKEASQLLTRRAESADKLRKMREFYDDGDPKIQKYRADLDSLESELLRRKREVQNAMVKQRTEQARSYAHESTASLRQQITILKELEKQLLPEIRRLTEETRVIKDSTLDLDGVRDDIAQIEVMAKTVAGRAESLRVELDAPARVTLLEKPTVSHLVDGRKQIMAVAVSTLAGLGFGFFIVLGKDLRSRRVFDPLQISNALRMRVLGTLPALSTARLSQMGVLANNSVADNYPRNLLAESVDRARLKILHAAGDSPLRVILITSAISGEGKTSVSGHLAISLARAGRRTLLIDADLRRPALHRLFDLSLEPGFAAALRDEAPIADVIRPTYVRGLEVIPAGRGDLSAIQALGGERVRGMFDELRQTYDYVLVDSAPILAVVDAPFIAQHVDGILFSVMCGVSNLPELYQSYHEIALLGAPILGAVVSGVRDSSGAYSSYGQPLATEKAAVQPN